MDFETMYRAMDSRDARFDGRFFVAVKTTGVYCRPICPAPTPRRHNTLFYRYAAVAEMAGFRPCRRCRPEVSPDSPEWDTRADLAGRGLRLIAEGVVDEDGVAGLARRLGVSERHLQRVFKETVGVTPGPVARSRRARLARQLLAETTMPITQVAFASGFSSVRAFNETIQQVYRVTPSELRRGNRAAAATLTLHLGLRTPFAAQCLLRFLADRAIPGVEEVVNGSYRRTIEFGSGSGVMELTPTRSAVSMRLDTPETDHLAPVIQRARRLMDLDADPSVIDGQLGRRQELERFVVQRPGIRLPGAFDPFETAVLIVLQQGASPKSGARQAGRIAAEHGEELAQPVGGLRFLFPSARVVAEADLGSAGISPPRAATLRDLAHEICSGKLDLDGAMTTAHADRVLSRIRGIGPVTRARLRMHVLRDPDSMVLTPLEGLEELVGASDRLERLAAEWRPWRGYAAMHLWAGLTSSAARDVELGQSPIAVSMAER